MKILIALMLSVAALQAQEVRPAIAVDEQEAAAAVDSEKPPTGDLEFFPKQAQHFALQGNQEFAAGDYESAEKSYRKVLELAPENLLGLVNLGTVLYRLGKYEDSEKTLKRAIERQVASPAAWMTLGFMYLEQERLDEATAAFAQAVVFDPGNARVRNYYGVTIGRKGWYHGAESELRKAVEIDPAYSEAHFNLAVFYLERTPPATELARRHYQRALELGAPNDPVVDQLLERKDD